VTLRGPFARTWIVTSAIGPTLAVTRPKLESPTR
jgi:hypothetical protein